jgi:hypothetical protein
VTSHSDTQELVRENEALRDEVSLLQKKLAAAQAQNASLSNTVACLYTLHASPDRASVMQIVDEIIINLIGSEEFAVVQWKDKCGWQVIRTFGVDSEIAFQRIGVMPELTNALLSGRASVAANASSAAVPLMGSSGILAVIAIFRLLPQKPLIVPADHEIFELLTSHAGIALDVVALREARG